MALDPKTSSANDDQAKLRLAYAAETRRFEIERFWQRSLLFWTILGAAFIGYAALAGKDEGARLAISCFGVVTSLAWTLQNRGSKYWHEAWEQKTERYQVEVLGVELFSQIEPVKQGGWFGARRYSVTRISVILSDFTALIWFGITGHLTLMRLVVGWPCATKYLTTLDSITAPLLLIVTATFCVFLLRSGRANGLE